MPDSFDEKTIIPEVRAWLTLTYPLKKEGGDWSNLKRALKCGYKRDAPRDDWSVTNWFSSFLNCQCQIPAKIVKDMGLKCKTIKTPIRRIYTYY